MAKAKRSYYLPEKLIKAFGTECGKGGYVMEKVVAASILNFLQSNANARAKMFDQLDKLVQGKKR